jgi:hypothetical protein
MKLIKGCVIGIVMLALTAGCMPKRMPEEKGKRIPLSQVLTTTLKRYAGVNTLQTRLFVQLELKGEYYILRGILLYERPACLRLRLTHDLGGTVGEVIYNEGLLFLLLPTEEKIYQGWIEEGESQKAETLFLTMVYSDYAERAKGPTFPTRIYGQAEGMEVRFDMKLKDPQVDLPLPQGAFCPPTAGWEIHPLEDLKDLLHKMGAAGGP